jgi:hypothetical protein
MKGLARKATIHVRFLLGLYYQTDFPSHRRVCISKDVQWIHFFAERHRDTVCKRNDCRLPVTVVVCKTA